MAHPDTLYDETNAGGGWWWSVLMLALFFGVGGMILYPNYVRLRSSSVVRYTVCQANCKNIGTALEMYADDNNGAFPAKLEMLVPDYLRAIPTCSAHEAKIELIRRKRPGYNDTYQVSDDFSAYTFYCGSRDHDTVGVQDNYPQYNSREGLIPK